MRNTYRYTRMYSGSEPQFLEGDVFHIIIPLTEVATATVGPKPAFPTSKPGETNSSKARPCEAKPTSNEAMEMPGNQKNEAMDLSTFDLKVLQAILNNPQVARQELRERLGISESAAYRAVRKLKAEGIIVRIGSKRYGRWEINLERQSQHS